MMKLSRRPVLLTLLPAASLHARCAEARVYRACSVIVAVAKKVRRASLGDATTCSFFRRVHELLNDLEDVEDADVDAALSFASVAVPC